MWKYSSGERVGVGGEDGGGMEKVVVAWRRWWCVHGQWRIVFYHACSQLDFLCSNALHALTLGGHLDSTLAGVVDTFKC